MSLHSSLPVIFEGLDPLISHSTAPVRGGSVVPAPAPRGVHETAARLSFEVRAGTSLLAIKKELQKQGKHLLFCREVAVDGELIPSHALPVTPGYKLTSLDKTQHSYQRLKVIISSDDSRCFDPGALASEVSAAVGPPAVPKRTRKRWSSPLPEELDCNTFSLAIRGCTIWGGWGHRRFDWKLAHVQRSAPFPARRNTSLVQFHDDWLKSQA